MFFEKLLLYIRIEFFHILQFLYKLLIYLFFEFINVLILIVWIMVTIAHSGDPELCRNPHKYDHLPSLCDMLNENYSRFFLPHIN